MANAKTIVITVDEYKRLKQDAHMLQCLEDAGLDNWDGCWYARQEYIKTYTDDDDEGVSDEDL